MRSGRGCFPGPGLWPAAGKPAGPTGAWQLAEGRLELAAAPDEGLEPGEYMAIEDGELEDVPEVLEESNFDAKALAQVRGALLQAKEDPPWGSVREGATWRLRGHASLRVSFGRGTDRQHRPSLWQRRHGR